MVCYTTCLQNPVLRARVYHHGAATAAFPSLQLLDAQDGVVVEDNTSTILAIQYLVHLRLNVSDHLAKILKPTDDHVM